MAMTKTGKVPTPQQQSRDGSGFLSSPKWPQAAPPPFCGHQSPLSRQPHKLLLKFLHRALKSHPHLDKPRRQQPPWDFSPQGGGGAQKIAGRPERLSKPLSSPLTAQDSQLFLPWTRQNNPLQQLKAAKQQRTRQAAQTKRFPPSYQIKPPTLCQTKKLWRYQRKPKLWCHLRACIHWHLQRLL